jgi:hypothetical protein
MEKIGFFLAFAAFLVESVERYFEQRARVEETDRSNPLILAGFTAALAVLVIGVVLMSGGLGEFTLIKIIVAIPLLGAMGLALNSIGGGVDMFPNLPGRIVQHLGQQEAGMRRLVFPTTFFLAFLALVCEVVALILAR